SVAANKLVGNQASFRWGNVAASALSAYAGSELGIGNSDSLSGGVTAGSIALDTFSGVANSALSYGADKLFGNQASWNFGNVAVDAFGNALGNSIVSGLSSAPKSNNKQSDSEFIKDVESFLGKSDSFIGNIDNMLGSNQNGIYDAEGNFIPSDELYVSNDPIDDFTKYGTEGKEAYAARKLAEANEKRGFWDAIHHNDRPASVETEFGFSLRGKLPYFGKFDIGFAAAFAFDNKGNVAFQPLANEYGGGLGGSDWSGGLNLSVLAGEGLHAQDIVYGEMITGGPSIDLISFNKARLLGKQLPDVGLAFDYEIGAALTGNGPMGVRGFEFGLDMAHGGTKLGSDITYQNSPTRSYQSNWGVVGQLFWAYQNVGIKTINKFMYKGMDVSFEHLAKPHESEVSFPNLENN
ncbi:hypothetical protein J8L98_24325, partial [Pseudoalteromonas sp. MMG013]|uniref:hypothetical protein n=1 Tax=Pseudoalteromonas sp. MMG013 TaxID=2822687 RepID=UPI001B39B378